MTSRAAARLVEDGRRLHLQHGPIDLIVDAVGEAESVRSSYQAAADRFDGLLEELCEELPLLRRPVVEGRCMPRGPVALRMHRAVRPFADEMFITPMAAVAGAVAEEILLAMSRSGGLRRASVNNGGDIAFHLAPGESLRVGLVERPDRLSLFAKATISSDDAVRGIATSGYPGRSFSLGIAEAVTVLARTAAMADAAATVIANAVDLPGHPAIAREPACALQPDSDLGAILVTRNVGPLTHREIDLALQKGLHEAERLRGRGLIASAAVHLQGRSSALPAPVISLQPKDRIHA